MEPERWGRVQEVFHGAAARSGADREAFLEAACAGDGALRAEVESLLAEDARRSSLLDGEPARAAAAVLGGGEVPPAIGPYRITGVLGEGGMGVVYRATRDDLAREVALKVLRDAWVSPARRDRFDAERRTLAALEHPSIARLYDSGVLPDGTPWFAMELVEGEPLTAYCARRVSTLRERLARFREACAAVAFAQGLAIVHRDVKPSNVLARADGTVKLIDFGIAKQLDPTEPGADATRTGLRLMTPAYAAPEQLRGEAPGLPTDVWGLGVVLYEILTGRRPFDRPGLSPGEVERAVLEAEPERPSAAARAAGPGSGAARASARDWDDLDVLCLAALRKDPARRYRSAEALLRDVDHLLGGQPLDARPESLRYRAGKFVRRHRWAVAAAAAALLALAGTVALFTLRLARARDAALAEAARAQRVEAFMLGLFEGGDREAGPAADLRVVELLDRGAQQADTLAAEPAAQADLLATLGSLNRRLARQAEADALLGKALERHRALRGEDDPAVADDLVALGQLRADQGRLEEAEALVSDGLARLRRTVPDEHPGVARALVALGAVLGARGAFERSEQVHQEAIALRSRPGVSPLELAGALSSLADVLTEANRFDDSDALGRRALELYRARLGDRHPLVAERLDWLAWNARARDRFAEAEGPSREALAIYDAWYGRAHPKTAAALAQLAGVLVEERRLDEGEPPLREALAIQERLHGPVHPQVGETVYALAILEYRRGRYEEAVGLCARAQGVFRKALGPDHAVLGMAHVCEAVAWIRLREWARAEAAARAGRAIILRSLPAESPNAIWSGQVLGGALVGLRRYAEAEPLLRVAWEAQGSRPRDPAAWEDTLRWIVEVYRGLGRRDEAARFEAELAAHRAATAAGPPGAGAK